MHSLCSEVSVRNVTMVCYIHILKCFLNKAPFLYIFRIHMLVVKSNKGVCVM
jgi:hypothetical protein